MLGCQSSNAWVSLQGEVAVFMHDVAPPLRQGAAEHRLQDGITDALLQRLQEALPARGRA